MNILYFALIPEHVGKSSESIQIPDDVTTVGGVIDHLETLGENYKSAFAQPDLIRASINNEYVNMDHQVTDKDELALFPPMSGG